MSTETFTNELPACATAPDNATATELGSGSFPAAPATVSNPIDSISSDSGGGLIRRALPFLTTVGFAFGIVGLQLAQGVLLARLLGPEGRGEYATIVLYVQVLLYIGLFGGLEVVCRYAADGKVDLAKLRRSALWLGVTTGTVTMLAVIVCSLVAIPQAKQSLIPLAVLCSLSMIGQHIVLIMTAVDRGAGQFMAYNWRRLIAAAAFPVLLLTAALFLDVDSHVACYAFVIGSFLSVIACVVGLPKPVTGPNQPAVGSLIRESRPYAASMFVTELFERLDLLLVMWLVTLETQGFYAAMVPAVYPLTVIPNTLGVFLFNAGAKKENNLAKSDVVRVLVGSLLVQTISAGLFMLVISDLVRLVYGEAYQGAVIFALWLAPVSAIRGIIQGLDSYVKGLGRPLAAVRCRLVAAAVLLAVSFALFDRYGAVAIAMGALAGQVVCFVWLSGIVFWGSGGDDSQVAVV